MLRGGLIGCGRVAALYHMPCYRKMSNVRIVAACDASLKKVSNFCRKNNIPRFYTEITKLLEKEKLDFVDICTPPFTHHRICSIAIEYGTNILVEKPIALSLNETIDLKLNSERKNTKLCIIHNYRFKKNVINAMKMYKEGKIGEIQKVITTVHQPSFFPSWFWDEEKSGGILYESAIHFIDIQTMFCGEHEKIIGLYKKFNENLNLTTDICAIVQYKHNTVGIVDINVLSNSRLVRVDLYGTAADVHLKFYPDYFSTSLGLLGPYAELIGEMKRFIKYTGNMFFRGKKNYRRDYHFKLISDFVTSIELDIDPPVTIDSIMPTMKLLEDLKKV